MDDKTWLKSNMTFKLLTPPAYLYLEGLHVHGSDPVLQTYMPSVRGSITSSHEIRILERKPHDRDNIVTKSIGDCRL
jgi:hypothetical protein